MLCFPGTYTANTGLSTCKICPAGSSCKEYGTYVPKICEAGTYRSKADSITCKPCPPGTFLPHRGGTDITECLPCPSGVVCEKKGMKNLKFADRCEGGYICSSSTEKSNQYQRKCAGGQICDFSTTLDSQYNIPCDKGRFCSRGTSLTLRLKNRCKKKQFCPNGSSNPESTSNQCPRQTTSTLGAYSIRNCTVQHVEICDKHKSGENPLEVQSYYPYQQYISFETSEAIQNSSFESQTTASELKVLRKIIPINQTSSTEFWFNDTVEVIRSCPTYVFWPNSFVIPEHVTLIGKNFQNSSRLMCRFYIEDFNGIILWKTESDGIFISTTRVQCKLPQSPEQETLLHRIHNLQESCGVDDDDRIYFRRECKYDNDSNCFGSTLMKDRHERFYSIYVPCTESQLQYGQCENIPSHGYILNPCLSSSLIIEVSNNYKNFSGNDKSSYNPSSYTKLNVIMTDMFERNNKQYDSIMKSLTKLQRNHVSVCSRKITKEENKRSSEIGWFILPFMSQAQISIDWTHLPKDFKYDEHFKLALYVTPSRCLDSYCNDSRVIQPYQETSPCVQPIHLPIWFQDTTIDKHQITNLTILALDDVLIKPEIHLVHGLFLSAAVNFRRSLSITILNPSRSKLLPNNEIEQSNFERRPLSPFVSKEELDTELSYIFVARLTPVETRTVSPPLNLPPRWSDFERGRVLVSMNATHDNAIPTIKDPLSVVRRTNTYWDNPFVSPLSAKRSNDAFFETFHGLQLGQNGEYQYDMNSLMLPYFPFLSNCWEFDSYIPISHIFESYQCQLPELSEQYPSNWWRRNFSALPHRDFLRPIGPLDFHMFYPIADWCERKLYCEYEESLKESDITPRWFEAESGTTLFSLLRDPVNYYQYTGRDKTTTGINDGGGSKFMNSIKLSDVFIPVKIKRLGRDENCDRLCFPRKVTLDISFYQVNRTNKRIVDALIIYDKFDRDTNNGKYDLTVRFYPLNYQQLIIKFAFDRDIFLLLFTLIGGFTIVVSSLYWGIVRLTTRIKNPPFLRLGAMLWLMIPQALSGFILALLPITAMTGLIYLLFKGNRYADVFFLNRRLQLPLFDQIKLHYEDVTLDPSLLPITRQGRLGMAFFTFALVSMVEGSKLFIPRRSSKREKDIELEREHDAKKPETWDLVTWKRSNLVLCSFGIGLLSVMIVEWSYWKNFGKYIWEAILVLKFLDKIVGYAVDWQMGEALLCAPIMSSFGLIQSIVTLSANDFLDFLLSYIIGFGFLILERMYISPSLSNTITWIIETIACLYHRTNKFLHVIYTAIIRKDKKVTEKVKKLSINDALKNEGTVEPIIDSYAGYCLETLSLLYLPFVIVLLMIFRNDTEMPTRYGIKEQDMEYYVLFAMIIIPFQFIADSFIQGSLELFHGWKIYDYLVYTRYRFLQRETKWKGFEDTLDECIDEGVRTLDHMCFSSQFYMMTTIHVNGIVYMVLGMQMMIRANYNLFGDPAMPLILGLITISCFLLKKTLLASAWCLNIWRIRHENTAWHVKVAEDDEIKLPDWDIIRGASVDEFEMNKRISSETFRYKFMNYNKTWLIEQLPTILTPRTMRHSKPFLTNQLARAIHKLNSESSSDEDYDSFGKTFVVPDLSPSTKTLMKVWVKEGKRRMNLKDCVRHLIERAKGAHCQRCLGRNLLQVQMVKSFEEM